MDVLEPVGQYRRTPEPAVRRPAGTIPHALRSDAIGLRQSIVIGLGTSAPGQSAAVSMAAMVAAAAYATGPAILLSMLAMLAMATCYQRLNLFDQNCGGPYVWVARAINPMVGYFVAWTMLVGFVLGSVSDLLPLGPSLLGLLGLDVAGTVGNVVTATLFGLALTAVAALGIRTTARFQLLLAAFEYATLLTFCVIGFWAVFVTHRAGTVHPALSWLSFHGVGGRGSLSAAMLISIFLFAGWDAPMYLNEETKAKSVTPGRSVLWSVAVLGVIYCVLFVTLQGAVSPAKLAAHQSDALPYIASALVGHGWARFMVVAVILSVLGTTQATLVATSRVTYAMGTDRLLPQLFGSVSRRSSTPIGATIVWGVLTVLVVDLYVAWSSLANAFDTVVNALGIAFAVFWALTAVATVVYYRRVITRTPADFLLAAVLPLGAAGTLAWIVSEQLPQLPTGTRWTLLGLAVAGLVFMAFSAFVLKAPFFALERSSFDPGAPDRATGPGG
ncbi:MAG TPA: APC family permease [Acidimicrobiales bacterium]